MGGGSQLSKLKSTLRDSGLSRTSSPKDIKKRNKKSAASGAHRSAKLEAIGQDFNKFDLREENKKFQVVTRQGKLEEGKKGAPGKSRAAGLEQRKKTLLPLLEGRTHTSTFLDHRFGENSTTLTLEEKDLERFTAERTSRLGGGKKARFNLEDGDAPDAEGGLTHGGRKLGFGDEEELDAGGWGGLGDGGIANANHEPLLRRRMAAEAEAEAEGQPERKRTKAEIMEEVMAKSKAYKHERQKTKNKDDETRHALDAELKDLRLMLAGGGTIARPPTVPGVVVPRTAAPLDEDDDEEAEEDEGTEGEESDEEQDEGDDGLDDEALEAALAGKSGVDRELLRKLIGGNGGSDSDSEGEFLDEPIVHASLPSQQAAYDSTTRPAPARAIAKDAADPYDSYVRLLALEPRAQATDRLKTPLELAKEAAKELQEREESRLRRQRGEADGSDDEGPKKKQKRKPQGDDLEDDYAVEGSDDEEMIEEGLGKGLEGGFGNQVIVDRPTAIVEVESEEEDEDGEEEEDDEDEDRDVGDLSESEEEMDVGEAESLVAAPLVETVKSRMWGGQDVKPELPFTFPCPTTHVEFVRLLSKAGIQETDTATVVKRIRVLYHPQLGAENTSKLQAFNGVLLDHVLHLSANPTATTFATINSLLPHLLTLSHAYPLATAPFYVAKLALMQKNFVRGVARGVLDPASKTWPGVAELTLLRLVGMVWSTSDLSHPVAAAAMLLIGQYLSQARVRSLDDISAGLFLCTLAAQYEVLSKRLVPEAINFLLNAFLILVPSAVATTVLPGAFPTPDLGQTYVKSLRLRSSSDLAPTKLTLSPSKTLSDVETEQLKVNLLGGTLELLNEFATMYVSMDGFLEVFRPVEAVVSTSYLKHVPTAIKTQIDSLSTSLTRMLGLATSSRQPLLMQYHKPIPIATYIPKFDEGYNPNRKFDPDTERAETQKLKSLYKKEKKGAIRELRKDNRFLAAEEGKRKAVKDAEYTKKIATIMGGLQDERAEEKRFEATKSRGKKQDKARRK